ncbi:MAG: phospholipase [Myxococcaceae bacterium]
MASKPSTAAQRGRLTATIPRGAIPTHASPGPGVHPLGPGNRGGVLVVPRTYDATRAAPLLVFFHGAGADRNQGLAIIRDDAETLGAILLIPESQEGTWDFILDEYGEDVAALDEALKRTFTQFSIDPGRVAASGFSDGASYALSLGLANGDLFSHVIAFSPGFAAPREMHGAPRLFISHSPTDRVLPISRTSRRLVPKFQEAGYDVHYFEYEGGHQVPTEVRQEALRWFTGT